MQNNSTNSTSPDDLGLSAPQPDPKPLTEGEKIDKKIAEEEEIEKKEDAKIVTKKGINPHKADALEP